MFIVKKVYIWELNDFTEQKWFHTLMPLNGLPTSIKEANTLNFFKYKMEYDPNQLNRCYPFLFSNRHLTSFSFYSYWGLQLTGFYPSTFLQPVNGCKTQSWIELWNSISSSLFKYFFVCLSRKTLDRFFVHLHHFFLLLQASNMYRTNRLNYSIRNSTKKTLQLLSKNKQDGGADVAFFVSACVTHSLVERLSALTALLGNQDKSPGNVEA